MLSETKKQDYCLNIQFCLLLTIWTILYFAIYSMQTLSKPVHLQWGTGTYLQSQTQIRLKFLLSLINNHTYKHPGLFRDQKKKMTHSNASFSVIFVSFVLINKGEQRISLSTVVSPPLWKSWESGDLFLCLFCFLSISHTETKKVHRISLKTTTLNHCNYKDL